MRTRQGSMVVGAAVLCLAAPSVGRADGTTTRVSVSSREAQGNGPSFVPAISGDGRFVAFASVATNLVPGDTNNQPDTFLRDRLRGTTVRVSLGPGGRQQDGPSLGNIALTRNGRFLAFASGAENLVAASDTNDAVDVFVRDLRSGTTRRVSNATSGAEANGESGSPAISADGRFVAFFSFASNLVRGDTNDVADVFVRDRRTGTTTRESLGPGGTQGNDDSNISLTSGLPSLSADGRFLAFDSAATNLVAGDTNSRPDIFVRDRAKRVTIRVSVRSDGAQANDTSGAPSISADGRLVAFRSSATNLVGRDTNQVDDIFVRDLRTGTTRRVSVGQDGRQANDASLFDPAISADGRFVTFVSAASNLVAGDTNDATDVFVRDLRRGRTERVSLRRNGGQSTDDSGGFHTAISASGRYVAFFSDATNLVPGDTNETGDVFVRDRE